MTDRLYLGRAWIPKETDEYMRGCAGMIPSSSYVIIASTAEDAGEKLLTGLHEMTGHKWKDPDIKELTKGSELDLDWRVKVLGEVLDVIL